MDGRNDHWGRFSMINSPPLAGEGQGWGLCPDVRLKAYFIMGSLFEREINQNQFKIKQNLGEAPVGTSLFSESLFERER